MNSLTIWCNASLESAALALLKEGTAGHRLVLSSRVNVWDPKTDAPPPALEEADIAFGQPPVQAVIQSDRLRWVHVSSAGYTNFDRDDVRQALKARGALFSNSSHVFDEPCAEHVLAMMLGLARRLPQCVQNQLEDRTWGTTLVRGASYLLTDQTTLLLGYGAIGQRLAELLAPFRMRVIAVRRSSLKAGGVEIISHDSLAEALPLADHVVNVLPDNPSTRGFVDEAFLARMKPGARFYNVGRGATVQQDALLAALQSGHLAAAYLDVTSPEPLPPDHPLWRAPNCWITPHCAGGHAGEDERLARLFLTNLRAFERGEELPDRVF